MTDRGTGVRPQTAQPPSPQLFGRGLLYALVWSFPLVAGIFVSPILAHGLPPGEFGALASGLALHQAIIVFALFGLDRAIVLQRSDDDSAKPARGLIVVGMLVALCVTLLLAFTEQLWGPALGFGRHSGLIFTIILWTVPAASVQIMLALLLTEDRFRQFALVSGLSAVGGQLIGLVLLLTVRNDAATYALGFLGSQFAGMLLGASLTSPSIRGLANWAVTRQAVKLGLPLAMGGFGYFLLSAGDRIVIQVLLNAEEAGRYQAAYVVGSVVILLVTFTGSAWTPRFAALRDPAARAQLVTHSRDALYRLLMPVVLGVTLGAPVALQIVVPQSFRPESLTVVVFLIALAGFPAAAGAASSQLLITEGRGNAIGVMTAAAGAASVILNVLVVPLWGIVGAAATTTATYTLWACLQRSSIPRSLVWQRPPARLIAAGGIVAIAAAASTGLPQTQAWNGVRLLAALSCLLWFIGAFKRVRTELADVSRVRADHVAGSLYPELTEPSPERSQPG